MAHSAAQHPDELVFSLLSKGYDGQNFFDTEHVYVNDLGVEVGVSNMQAGAELPWFLLDTSRPVKPMVFQERLPYEMQRRDGANDSTVFDPDEYRFGIRARANAGFGLWQLAHGSKALLNADNYATARASMQVMRYDGGRIMGLSPTVLVVPPGLESAARKLLKSTRIDGSDNEWAESAELLVVPYLAA